jgi:WD40 repeat protein
MARWKVGSWSASEVIELPDTYAVNLFPSPSGSARAVKDVRGNINVFEQTELRPAFSIKGTSAHWSKDSHYLLAWDRDQFGVYNASSGDTVFKRLLVDDRVTDGIVLDQSGLAVFITYSGDIHRIALASGQSLGSIRTDSSLMSVVSINDDTNVQILDNQGNLHAWDLVAGTKRTTRAGHSAVVTALNRGDDTSRLVSADDSGDIALWNLTIDGITQTKKIHEDVITSIAVSPGEKFVSTMSHDGSVKLFDVNTLNEIWSVPFEFDNTHMTRGLAFLKNGEQLVAAFGGREPAILNSATGKVIDTLTGHKQSVWGLHYDEVHNRIYSMSRNEVAVWDATTYTLIAIDQSIDSSAYLAFDLDTGGDRVFVGCSDGSVVSFRGKTLAQRNSFQAHSDDVSQLLYDSTRNILLTAGHDRTLAQWDVSGTARKIETTELAGLPRTIREYPSGHDYLLLDSSQTITVVSADHITGKITYTIGNSNQRYFDVMSNGNILSADLSGNLSILTLRQ